MLLGRNVKVGDAVITLEKGYNIKGVVPNEDGICVVEHESIVVAVEPNYIETTYIRKYNPEWIVFDTEKGNRAYKPQFSKNYFGPNGEINLKLI